MKHSAAFAVLALVATLVSAAPASAEELTCGQVITTSVVLTHDLRDCPDDGLVVGASNIVINLNGHTIDGDEPPDYVGGNGIVVPGPYHGVTIKNGTIRGFSWGIELNNTKGNKLKQLTVTENNLGLEIEFSESNVVRDLWFDHNRDANVRLLSSDHNRIRGNHFEGGRWGVILSEGSDSNRVVHNVMVGDATSTDRGIQIDAESAANVAARNRVRGFGQYGIAVETDAARTRVIENRVRSNGIHGILIGETSRTVVKRNRSNNNFGDGIHVLETAANATVTGNVTNKNGGWGIAVLTDVRDPDGNRARRNGQPDQCFGIICRIR